MEQAAAIDRISALLDADISETPVTSVPVPAPLAQAAELAAEVGAAASAAALTAAVLRSALEALVMQAALDEHYRQDEQSRPDLWAEARAFDPA